MPSARVLLLGAVVLCHVCGWGLLQDIPALCGQLNAMQVRMVVTRAIQNARQALERQKQLNMMLSNNGFDEAMNPSPYMHKTYHQHYAAFSHLNLAASLQVDSGFIITYATREIINALRVNPEDLYRCPGVAQIWHEQISPFCLRRDAMCDVNAKYRSIDGSCNNLQRPLWGRSNRPHRRLLPPQYMDDIGIPRQTSMTGEYLPSARTVSNAVHNQAPCCPKMERDLSLYVMQWGQMLDHDITDTAIAKGHNDATIICCNLTQETLMQRLEIVGSWGQMLDHDITDTAIAKGHNDATIICCNLTQETLIQRSDCFPIPIAPGDQRFQDSCMNFVRSISGHADNCEFGRREQLNQATSFLDASFLYGHNDEDAGKLREFRGGLMKMTDQMLFPPGLEDQSHCELDNPADYCMKSGDFRIHVMPGLTAMQVVFLREHNRVAKLLQMMNPSLCDEDIYQEARKIVIAEMQHVTYAHWLPHVLGTRQTVQMGLMPTPMGHNTVYDQNQDPTITNVFGVSAFRFGHTLLQDTVLFMKDRGTHIRNEMAFNRPGMIFQDQAMGCTFVGMGLALHPASKADGEIVGSVRNNLFLDMNGQSFDLISLNIQRGRDHGVPGYNAWRQFCGLPVAVHFGTGPMGFVHHTPENVRKLHSVYRHPDDVDIFTGGISETPVEGAVLGPLFSCIIGKQFYNLKYGDRFYYENADPNTGFNMAQLNSIKRMTLAKLMCLHFHVPHVQMNPFRMPGPNNPMVNCNMVEDIDLSLWKQ